MDCSCLCACRVNIDYIEFDDMTSRDGHINNNTESHDNTKEKMSGSHILKQDLDVSQGRENKTDFQS